MDDYISRQAAIDALAELARDSFTIKDTFQIYLDALKDADLKIRQMPTAEPIGELIRCRDCKHFHENVWGNEIGLDDLPIIVGHEACDAWGREWTQSFADGFCHMAERRNDG